MSGGETPWTPGPWDCTGCKFPDDNLGGVYYRIQAGGIDARAANARLIAAAPEMAKALQSIAFVDDDGWTSDGHERCTELAARILVKIGGAA